MSSNFSDRLKLELMATGANANTWGTNTNNSLEVLDAFAAGYLSKSVAGSSNITLTTANASDTAESSNKVIELTGALTGDIKVFIPAVESEYLFFNNTTGSQTLTNKTLTSPTINTPIIGTSLNDANGNEFIKFTTVSSAVNELTIANGASTAGPTLSATGTATNLNIIMTPKGTGSVELNKAAFSSSTITANGAASTSATLIIGNKGSQLDVSLADGTTVGEYKIFTNKGAGAMHVTPTNFAQGTKFVLAQNDGCTCIWDGSNWFLVGNQGEVTVS